MILKIPAALKAVGIFDAISRQYHSNSFGTPQIILKG